VRGIATGCAPLALKGMLEELLEASQDRLPQFFT